MRRASEASTFKEEKTPVTNIDASPCASARPDSSTINEWLGESGLRAQTKAEREGQKVLSEPVIVPRSAQEDDAWVLDLVLDATTEHSYLARLDGKHLEDGPVARALLTTDSADLSRHVRGGVVNFAERYRTHTSSGGLASW